MSDGDNEIQRFVVLVETYSRLCKKSGSGMSGEEMEGLYYALVTRCSSPDEFYKLVEQRKAEDDVPEMDADVPVTADDGSQLTDVGSAFANKERGALLSAGYAWLFRFLR